MSTGLQSKRGRADKGLNLTEKVVVAVKASKEISKNALVWALTHVVQPGDCLTLLVVMPLQSSGTIIQISIPLFFFSFSSQVFCLLSFCCDCSSHLQKKTCPPLDC